MHRTFVMLTVIHWANSWLPSLLAYLATTASHRNTRQFNPFTPMSDQLHISPCMQPHQKYNITQSGELMAFHSLLGWKMIVIPILTTSCEGQNEVFMKCIMLFSLNILLSRLLCTFTGWPHKFHPGQRTLSWETITIYLFLCIVRQSWHVFFTVMWIMSRGIKSQGIVYFGV